MTYNFDTMGDWEKRKACFLINTALDLRMNLDGYGELSVNTTSGYTYLWLEDYNFTLYMPINCKITKAHVYALYTDPETGEEIETSIAGMGLCEIEKWVNKLIFKL